MTTLRIDRARLWDSLLELKQIGAYHDDATGLQGVRRLALTDADAEARRRCVGWMLEAGLEVRVDRIGNVYATRPGTDRSLPCVLMGSHIDTVATGGAFDGTLGVLGGIEVMRTLDDAGVQTLRDVEVGFFTEEEGMRFGTDMLGSAVTAGRIPIEHAWQLPDAAGATVKDELERIGFDGPAHERRPGPHAYIECHIEQGPVLADAGVPVGIVEGVQSISWQRLTVHGEAAHAGTTPIGSRHDAGLVAAAVVLEARRMCDSGGYGQLRATVGSFDIGEGQTNVVPHRAVITVDLRNPDDAMMTKAEKDLAEYVDALAEQHGVTVEWERMAKTAVVPFDPAVQDLLARTAEELGLGYVRTMSGAGHDAQEIAAICPTAMVFVRGENGGISHTPREYSTPQSCGDGTDVLANAVLSLANRPGPGHTSPPSGSLRSRG
ncbi:MAG: M20 family metallo-hydrolase [Actinomycetes bacterium]